MSCQYNPSTMDTPIPPVVTKGLSQPIVTKYAGFNDFMMKHLKKKGDVTTNRPITNTRIGDKGAQIWGGSYSISEEEYPTFLQLYAKDILSSATKKEYLTEVQLDNDGPILVDLDLRHDLEVDERQYTKEHIEDMLDIYLEKLKPIFQFDDASKFKIFVMEKPTVNRVAEKNCTKDGIHIIIGLKADRIVQSILREQVMPEVAEAWDGLPITNSWEDVFDKAISDGTVGWQLYGSRKPNHERYKVTSVYEVCYDVTDGEFMRNEMSLSKYDVIANINELSVRNKNNPSFFLKSNFMKVYDDYKNKHSGGNNSKHVHRTITNRTDDMFALYNINSSAVASIRTKEDLDSATSQFVDSIGITHYELKDAYFYTMTLPNSYYGEGSYTKWMKVAWSLKNTSDKLLIVWIAFSAQSPTFDYSLIPDLCEQWRKFEVRSQNGVTKLSLMHWSRTDAPEEFERVRLNSLDHFVNETLKTGGKPGQRDSGAGPGDFDIARVLHQMFKHEFVCTSVAGKRWLNYKNHRWQENDMGTTLRHHISTTLRDVYRNKAVGGMRVSNDDANSNRSTEDEPVAEQDDFEKTFSHRILAICQRAAKTNDKNNIMREAMELFYDGSFINKLDSNPYLLCCKNGVFDFKEKVFRPGYPEDYISMSTNIDYVKINPSIHQNTVNEITDFMHKLFPEPQLCEYMWDHLSSTLLGTSTNQTFNMYIGGGQNGKSVLVNLMEIILGEYKGDVPLTLVTDRRGKVGGLAPEIVQLKGKRYAVMQEPSKGDVINEGIMKQLTSGKDPIQGRAPYMPQTISFVPQFKLVVTCNVFMGIKSNDHGTWRRIRAVPFKALFTENPVNDDPEKPYQFQLDKSIDEKFDSWKEVFLAMLIDRACKTNGIVGDCNIVMEKSNEYRKSQDYLSEFASDCILREKSGTIQKSELNNEFNRWYETNYGGRGPSPKDLHEYIDRIYGKSRNARWVGVKIKYQDNDDDEEDVLDDYDDNIDENQL